MCGFKDSCQNYKSCANKQQCWDLERFPGCLNKANRSQEPQQAEASISGDLLSSVAETLREGIKDSIAAGEHDTDKSWGLEEGVLLNRREAQAILDFIGRR